MVVDLDVVDGRRLRSKDDMSDIDSIHTLREGFVAAFKRGDIEGATRFLTNESVECRPGEADHRP